MIRARSILALAAFCVAAACADPRVEPPELIPTALEVSPQSLDFEALFATDRLEATVFDQNGNVMTGATVSWQSSSFEVARVDQAGLVTAVDNGEAYILATSGEAQDSARVAVQQRPHSVRIPPPDRRILDALEDTVRLTAAVLDPNGRPIADHAKRQLKGAAFASMDACYRRHRGLLGNGRYDTAMATPYNNARLALAAAYDDLRPGFEGLYLEVGGWAAFYAEVRKLASLSESARRESLATVSRAPQAARTGFVCDSPEAASVASAGKTVTMAHATWRSR